jgi:hypothetical protein
MRRLSAAAAAGIKASMQGIIAFAVALAAAGCGIRPLTSAELYGAAGRGDSGAGGSSVGGSGAGGSSAGSSGNGGGGGGMAGAQAGADGGGIDSGGIDGGGIDGDASVCTQPCRADQFCDELTGRCATSSGSAMLSGVVTDACSGAGLAALVGIAGQHVCSYQIKGSYFVNGLPLGTLKLAAAKTGYELYGDTVEIVTGGVVHDIRLMRGGGCTAPLPADNACTCTTASCTPP